MSEWPVGRHEEWVAQPAASIGRWLKPPRIVAPSMSGAN
jgi:hypothetical protein